MSAFAIVATLCALSFSFARAIEGELRDGVLFAGERFLHGGIFILFAALLTHLNGYVFGFNSEFLTNFLVADVKSIGTYSALGFSFFIRLITAITFFSGLMFVHTGIKALNHLLLTRSTRHNDFDDI